MRKKKAVGKKEIKGGVRYDEASRRGILPVDNLYGLAYENPTVNKIPDLIKKYERDEIYLSDKIDKYKKEKSNIDKNRHNHKTEELVLQNLENKKSFEDRKFYLDLTKYYTNIVGSLVQNGKELFGLGKDVAGSFFTFIGFAGNGVIFRVFLIIVALALIIGLGLASMYSPQFNDAKNNINSKLKDLVYPDFDNYLKGPNPFGGLNDMMKGLQDRIPGDFKYKFNSFTNSINYITTGKNQYEDFLIDREMITTGRCDNIIHMNFNNQADFLKEKTYCALKPNAIVLNFNSNLYSSSDYYQLDKGMRETLNYPDSYKIPIRTEDSGRFALNIDDSHYLYKNTDLTGDKYKYLPKLFKKDKNKIVFNDITSISTNPLSGLISMYGIKLLNQKYKDPIIIINDFNAHNTKIQFKTSLYYKDDNTFSYYNQSNILQDFTFDKVKTDGTKVDYYDIEMLLDQSGNNRHFVWKQNDIKYKPMLVKINNKFAIKFESRSILYQNIPISSPKMFIKSTIMVNNKDERYFNKIVNYMDLLSTTTSSTIKLKLSVNKNNFNINVIPPYDPATNSINVDNEKIEYNINELQTIKTNIDNGKIETLGCILDPRNEEQKSSDNRSKDGKILSDLTSEHNFLGYLYDLYIYDRTKMD